MDASDVNRCQVSLLWYNTQAAPSRGFVFTATYLYNSCKNVHIFSKILNGTQQSLFGVVKYVMRQKEDGMVLLVQFSMASSYHLLVD